MDFMNDNFNFQDEGPGGRQVNILGNDQKNKLTIGGVCGVIAGLFQILVAIAFIRNDRPIWWCLTSGIVWILTTAAFALSMTSRVYDLAVILRLSQVGVGSAMKIEFYMITTALNMIYTLCGIVLLPILAEDQPSPPPPVPARQRRDGEVPEWWEVLPSQIQARQSQRQLQPPDTRVQITQMPQQQPQSQAYPAYPASPPLLV